MPPLGCQGSRPSGAAGHLLSTRLECTWGNRGGWARGCRTELSAWCDRPFGPCNTCDTPVTRVTPL
eukprot:412286-Prorocentrum_minimum.AAC.1